MLAALAEKGDIVAGAGGSASAPELPPPPAAVDDGPGTDQTNQ
jgi:hypothetical protein